MRYYNGGGWFNNSNALSHSSRGLKSKIKVLSGLISEALLDLEMATFLLCPHRVFFSVLVCCGVKGQRETGISLPVGTAVL